MMQAYEGSKSSVAGNGEKNVAKVRTLGYKSHCNSGEANENEINASILALHLESSLNFSLYDVTK